jgi:hypothetical protein
MIVLLGDSNIEFDGHGWDAAFRRLQTTYPLVSIPGGTSSDVLAVLKNERTWYQFIRHLMDPDAPTVVKTNSTWHFIINTGINDMIQKEGYFRYVKNHIDMLRHIKKQRGLVCSRANVYFMPSHYTGHWKLELRRRMLQAACWFVDAEFIDLKKRDQYTVYNSPEDPWHLFKMSYEIIAQDIQEKDLT